MLYKNAWQELRDYIKRETCLPEYLHQKEHFIRHSILTKMNELEKRWKIIPKKGANDEPDKNG